MAATEIHSEPHAIERVVHAHIGSPVQEQSPEMSVTMVVIHR